LGEFLGGAFDGVGCLQERSGPALVAEGCPCRLGCNSSGNHVFQVVEAVDGRFAYSLTCRGIKNGPAGAGRRDNGREECIVSFQGLLHFE
jgi:hypothetical protein